MAHSENLKAKTTAMKVSYLLFGFFLIFSSACRCKETPSPDDALARISCFNQNFITTRRGVLSLQNFELGDIVMYNKSDHSMTKITSVPLEVFTKRPASPVITSEKVAFKTISSVEVFGNLSVNEKSTIAAAVESHFKREISLKINSFYDEHAPNILAQMDAKTEAAYSVKHHLSNRYHHDSIPTYKDNIYFVVDRVYYCKEAFLTDAVDKQVKIGAEIPVKALNVSVKLSVDNSCYSVLETTSENSFGIIYGLQAFSFNKHFWQYTAMPNPLF
jgi:hypothetical protein